MTDKKRINVVVTDLDDTIWDWFRMWHNSFYPYLQRISTEFNIDLKYLKEDFKDLHQKYKTSESSFIYKELKSLSQEQKDKFETTLDGKKNILHEYYSNKKNNLILFQGVYDTLKFLKNTGVLVIGFTESNTFFTKYRIKHLQLDGLIDVIYAPVDFDVPPTVYKYYEEGYWEPSVTEFRYLPSETKKPAPEILEIILKDFMAKKENAIYIGDKLDKDVFMANEASIMSIYAKYGHQIELQTYNLLREVTHWSDADVQREIDFKKNHNESPIAIYTLEKSFEEIKNHFDFFAFTRKSIQPISPTNIIDIWKKIIDVQQHFNDLALRIRNIALTVFTFIIGGIGYAQEKKLFITITENHKIPYGTLIAFWGVIIMFAFFYMDRGWYHRLLLGAVRQGLELEKKWEILIPEMQLTNAIGKSSPHSWIMRKKIRSKINFIYFMVY